MRKKKSCFLIFVLLSRSFISTAQTDSSALTGNPRPHPSSFIVPAILIGYGFSALGWQPLKTFDQHIREEVWIDHPHAPFHLDNYLQYAPAAAVYALNAAGIKGLHDFRDRTVIYVSANAMMAIAVLSLKKAVNAPRPDGSANDGFPSGHAATAFLAAEFMRQEYRNRSPWYGIAAYVAAAGTGYLRVYNDKHWASEILVGAGIGMLAGKASYWIFPWIERKFLPARKQKITLP